MPIYEDSSPLTLPLKVRRTMGTGAGDENAAPGQAFMLPSKLHHCSQTSPLVTPTVTPMGRVRLLLPTTSTGSAGGAGGCETPSQTPLCTPSNASYSLCTPSNASLRTCPPAPRRQAPPALLRTLSDMSTSSGAGFPISPVGGLRRGLFPATPLSDACATTPLGFAVGAPYPRAQSDGASLMGTPIGTPVGTPHLRAQLAMYLPGCYKLAPGEAGSVPITPVALVARSRFEVESPLGAKPLGPHACLPRAGLAAAPAPLRSVSDDAALPPQGGPRRW